MYCGLLHTCYRRMDRSMQRNTFIVCLGRWWEAEFLVVLAMLFLGTLAYFSESIKGEILDVVSL